MERAIQCRSSSRRRAERVDLRAADAAHCGGAAVLLMIGMEYEKHIQRLRQCRLGLVFRFRDLEHHAQEIGRVVELVVRMDVRHADAVSVREGGERRHLADQPVNRQLPLGGIGDLLCARVESRQRGEGAHEHPHRVGVVVEAVHELLQVLVDERVLGDLFRPVRVLILCRQLAVDQEIGHLEIAALLCKLFYRVSPVLEYPFVTVNERDRALACGSVHVRGVIGHHPEVVILHLDLAQIDSLDRVILYR